jgi:hypothetical protein
MKDYGVGGTLLGGFRPRQRRGLAYVFLDRGFLDSLNRHYWGVWPCPQIFHCREDEVGVPPRGWASCLLRVPHAHAGGSTESVWTLVLWMRLGLSVPLPRPLRCDPWTLLLSRLDSMIKVTSCPAPPRPAAAAPVVLLHDAGTGVVAPEGLFPHRLLSRWVLAPCTFSATGFAVRALAEHELWRLWDVPILLQDFVSPGTDDAVALNALVDSTLAKTLLLDSDCLLSGFVLGGWRALKAGAQM